MKKTILLAFSGGLDSTSCAVKLKRWGHIVTLGFVDWRIQRSRLGELQNEAAHAIASTLELDIHTLGNCYFNSNHQAKYSWVQSISAMIMWEAAYPIMRYDAVAFGIQAHNVEGMSQRGAINKDVVDANARVVNYQGEIMFPVDGIGRQEQWDALPADLADLVWCCNLPTPDGDPCGHCYKCKHDRLRLTSV